MKMLQLIIDCKSLENSQEKVYDATFPTKVTYLQCGDCITTVNRLAHRFFSEYVLKTSFLKRYFKKKSIWCTSVSIKLKPYSAQPASFFKMGLKLDLFEEALNILFYSQENLGGSFFPVKLQV